MSGKSSRYDSMLAVLGDKNDFRGRLFLDDLYEQYQTSGKVGKLTSGAIDAGSVDCDVKGYESDLKGRGTISIGIADLESRKLIGAMGVSTKKLHQFFVALIQKVGKVQVGTKDVTGTPTVWAGYTKVEVDGSKLAGLLSNITGRCGSAATGAGANEFNINIDKYFMQRLWERTGSDRVSGSTDFFGEEPKNDFTRNDDDKLVDEKGVEVGHGSVSYMNLKSTDNCYTTAVKPGECTKYMRGCLLGDDIKGCAGYLADHSFWDNMAKEVENMNPAIAVDTLRAFGFEVNDNSNGNDTVQSTESWLEGLKNNDDLTEADVDKIVKNVKLVGYLDAVVSRVNANPAILNKDEPAHGLSGTGMQKYGIRAKTVVLKPSVATMYRIRNMMNAHNMRMSVLFGVSSLGGLFGGSVADTIEAAEEAEPLWASSYFARLFSGLNDSLGSLGKKIEDSDRAKVTKMIDDLRDSEEKLYKTMKYAAKYHSLLELYGQKHSPSVLNMDTLKKFVDARNKYLVKSTKRQESVAGVLTAIVKSINNEVVVGTVAWPDTV